MNAGAIAGLAWLAAVIVIAAFLRWAAKRRDHGDALAKTPVPPPARGGTGTTPGAGKAPPFPAPAPGLHHRGGHMVIDVGDCGCIHTWTRATGWRRDYDCIDEEIRGLLAP